MSDIFKWMQFEASRKSLAIPYLFLLLFWWTGGHMFYVGRVKHGLIWVGLTTLSLFLLLAGYGAMLSGTGSPSGKIIFSLLALLLLASAALLVADALCIPRWVKHCNQKLIESIGGDISSSLKL